MTVTLITGTSTGIGLATALACGRGGHRVYAAMRKPDGAPELGAIAAKEKLPLKILPMNVDDDASVRDAVAQVLADSGQIDVLVNNAGISPTGPIEEIALTEFRRAMETNYFGALRCIQAILPGMRERRSGHIINVSSIEGRMSMSPDAPYTGSKWALEGVSEILAGEVKGFGIHVSVVEPGTIGTPIFDKRRKAPADTRYPQERRMNALVAATLRQPDSPALVADKILEIVGTKTWKFRHTVGTNAAPALQYRASMSDEQWIDLMALESDQEWAAIIKRDFGLDLDLGKP
jgi:NAD(P)-dependent dehydrogenase (short-subunit alcohol dehydrogenase family)